MTSKKLFILPVLFIALGISAQEADLAMKPAAKSKYNVEIKSLTDVSQSMNGMEMKVNGSSVTKAVMEIEEVDSGGNFTVLSTWKEIKSSSSAMGKDTTMNFENLNLAMRTVYDKSGKIIKSERIDKSSSSDPGIAMIEQVAAGVKFPFLPAKTVKINETWESHSNDTITPPGGPFAFVTNVTEKYLFESSKTLDNAEYYKINVSGPVKISGEGSQMGMDMSIEGTGMSESYSLHDKNTLFPVLIESKVGLDMSIMIAGAQPMAIPMTQNITTTMKFTEVK